MSDHGLGDGDVDIDDVRRKVGSVKALWSEASTWALPDEVEDFVNNAPDLISEMADEIERLRQAESNVQRTILRLGARARLDGDVTWRKRMAELAEETTGVGIIPKSRRSDSDLTAVNELRKAGNTLRYLLALAGEMNDMWSMKGLKSAADAIDLQIVEVTSMGELPPLQHLWTEDGEPFCGDDLAAHFQADTPEESRAVPVCSRCHSKFASSQRAILAERTKTALADEIALADDDERKGLKRAESVVGDILG